MRNVNYWNLKYWKTGEWDVVRERLDAEPSLWLPGPDRCFRAFRLAPDPSRVRVLVVGQDPYPQRQYATGVAFSIPKEEKVFPPTLKNIFQEYQDDLHLPMPTHGNLERWSHRGVMLWNAYPSVKTGKPGSHHWDEWRYLTTELVERLSKEQVVFVLLGRAAQEFAPYCGERQRIICTSHPSPLGAKHGFLGSRVFSRVNDILRTEGKEEINWRLDESKLVL